MCLANGIHGSGKSFSKAEAKKLAAYEAIVLVLKAAGCCEDAWYNDMIEKRFESMVVVKAEKGDGDKQPIAMSAGKMLKNTPVASQNAHKQDSGRKMEIIPSKYPNGPIGLKYVGLVDVLNQIPEGKVITEKELLKWLGEAYGMDGLLLMSEEIPRPYAREKGIPFHRFLTPRGLIDVCYKDDLIAEGHELAETKTDNWRVVDYKETMADVSKLRVPDKEMAIGHPEHFLKFVNSEIREALEQGMRERGFLE